ncbi:MAG: hypothetical protein PWR20_170 [Bacteroidales bacterium]|jgi:AcrR family transcriptional regulator|nr:hypothetical protein [Bacteroidales bacterium]MDN5328466.1 hypothetical protein [Bacteroidales bacterium]
MRQSSEVRQEQIKQAVLDIIYTEGLKNLSTRNLAQRIGLSEGAIFRHFPTKKSIIFSIINDVQKDFVGKLRMIATSNEQPQKRLEDLLCFTVKYLTENKGITLLLFSEASHNNDEELKQSLMQIFNTQKKMVSKVILDGIAAAIWDESIPVENVAMLYMGIPVSLNVELVLNNGALDTNNFCSRMLLLINKMLMK